MQTGDCALLETEAGVLLTKCTESGKKTNLQSPGSLDKLVGILAGNFSLMRPSRKEIRKSPTYPALALFDMGMVGIWSQT